MHTSEVVHRSASHKRTFERKAAPWLNVGPSFVGLVGLGITGGICSCSDQEAGLLGLQLNILMATCSSIGTQSRRARTCPGSPVFAL